MNSASDTAYTAKVPFLSESNQGPYNKVYGYFLSQCQKKGLKAGFATVKDFLKPGLFQSCWTFNKTWKRFKKPVSATILFDKFLPTTSYRKRKRALILTSKKESLLNNEKTVELCTDKLATFNAFPKSSLPTVEVKDISKKALLAAKKELDVLKKQQFAPSDFGQEYVLKNRYGWGGSSIFRLNFRENLEEIIQTIKKKAKKTANLFFVLQPFLLFKKGFSFAKQKGRMDLRVVVLNQKILQCYARTAKKGDFRCNLSKGGLIFYVKKDHLSKGIQKLIQRITKRPLFRRGFFSLDFVQSNDQNLYLLEANASPGLYWDPNSSEDEASTKKLIRSLVAEFKKMVK
ncbi:hypothetical protein KJ972_01580 [Candidatus Micrarchaeota archaeon]|nr:hypothetical protein [Candidatus Micrarchaeota archaeon]